MEIVLGYRIVGCTNPNCPAKHEYRKSELGNLAITIARSEYCDQVLHRDLQHIQLKNIVLVDGKERLRSHFK